MKTRFLLSMLALLLSIGAMAQTNKNVQWRLTVKMTNATEGVATLKGMIEPGWHVYGTEVVKDGPQATVVDFSQSTGITLNGKMKAVQPPIQAYDDLFGKKLSWWEGMVTFKQAFKVKPGAKAQVTARVTYTSCNNVTCTRPITETLSKPVVK